MKEGKIDLMEWQKENLGNEEKKEIYGVPEKPETKFKGIDENKDNEGIVPEKSEVEKTEERLLEDNSRKRKGGLTGTEKKIEGDDDNDKKHDARKKQLKIGKKDIAREKREQTKPENIGSVQESEAKVEESEKNWSELESNMYEQLFEIMKKEYDEAGDKGLYIKESRDNLKKLTVIDSEDFAFLNGFGFKKEGRENKNKILALYKSIGLKILDEFENTKESYISTKVTENLNRIKKEIQNLDYRNNKEKEIANNFIKELEEYKELTEAALKLEELGIIKKAIYVQLIKDIAETTDEIKNKIEQVETELETPEEIEIPEKEDQEEIEKMSIEKLNEEVKKVNEYLNKIKEENETGYDKNTEFLSYAGYLAQLENAKKKLESLEIKVEIEKEPKTTREVIEQLGLLEELEMFESNLKAREKEKAEIEKYIDEKIKNGEEITQEDEDRRNKASEEVQMADININTARGVGVSLEIEKDTEDEKRILEKKIRMQNLLLTQFEVLGKIKGIEDKNIEKLSPEKQGMVKRYSSAVVNKGLEVFKRLIYEDSDQQATEPKKKSKFDWLKEKLRIGGKKEVGKIEEINEEIGNVTKLEDLAKVADFIEEKCEIKFKRSFKKSLEDRKSEVLRGNYNSAIEVINNSEEGSQKDALIKFYEKLDELLKEIEGEESPVDIIGDISPVEEIEPIKLTPETPEIETLETEEISEEIKGKIREGLVELKERDRTVFDNLEGFINSFLSSEKFFSDDFSKVQFNSFIKGDMDLEYEDIENIKTNDFMKVLREVYEEVKKGKENTTNDDRKSSEKDKKPEKIEEKNEYVDFKEAVVNTLHLGGGNHKEECVKIKKEMGVNDNKFSIFLKVMEDEIKNATSEDELSSIYKNGFDIYASFGSNRHLLKMINTSKGYHFKKIRKETAEKIEKLSKTNKGLSDELLKKIHLFFDIDHFPSTEETIKELEKY